MHRLLICGLAIVASCYRPRIEGECAVSCDLASAPDCPSGLQCGADGKCFDDIQCSLQPDAATDATGTPDMRDLDCAGTGWLADTCPTTIANEAIVLPATIDTTSCNQLVGDNCLIAADGIAAVGSVQVTGPRPLVLWARNNINVAVSSVIDVRAGSEIECPLINAGAAASDASAAAGGGPGATLGGRGGHGGAAASSVRALSPPTFVIASLRGGCRGGRGGHGPDSDGGGAGGAGGGAIYLIAGNAITVTGTIRAPGIGGSGAVPDIGTAAGGGGGGSGGVIVLDAPMITVSGVLHADGGGGGGGGRGAQGGSGSAATMIDVRANGGAAGGSASTAGAAGSGTTIASGANASDAQASGGAGGGGGGAGVIKTFGSLAQEPSAKVSPPST